MQSNTPNKNLNKNPWIIMTELKLGNHDEPPGDEKSTSSPESSEQQTPPSGTPLGLFGANKPALKFGSCSEHYKLSSSGSSIECSSNQHAPRFNPPHLDLYDHKPMLDKWLESVHNSIQEPTQDVLVVNKSKFINSGEEPETVQSKCLTKNQKSKKMKRHEKQGIEVEKQCTKNEQNKSKTQNNSNSEHLQMKTPEIDDEESISDLDIAESNSKNSS